MVPYINKDSIYEELAKKHGLTVKEVETIALYPFKLTVREIRNNTDSLIKHDYFGKFVKQKRKT